MRGNDRSDLGYVLWYKTQYTSDVPFIYLFIYLCLFVTRSSLAIPLALPLQDLKFFSFQLVAVTSQ